MKYELLISKRWKKTHLRYPLAANVVSLCRWVDKPDQIILAGKKQPTCKYCLKLIPFVKVGLGDITKEYALKLLKRLEK